MIICMKRIIPKLLIALTPFLIVSCESESRVDVPSQASGLMNIEVLVSGADEHDYVHKVRLIVFDNASKDPKLDVNEVIPVDDESQDAKVLKTNLKVTRNEDKMIIVILNEPDNLTLSLNQVFHPSHAENMMFEMMHAFSPGCTTPASTGMPMSGVKRGMSVTKDNATEETAAPVSISVERSVARLELWLRSEPGIHAEINKDTEIRLLQTSDKGYLATGTIADGTRFQTGENAKNNFGRMLDIPDPQGYIIWTYTAEQPLTIGTTPVQIAVFYTPERMCNADDDGNKLILELNNIMTSEGLRDKQTVLKEFTLDGNTQPEIITDIRRNNLYRTSGRITSGGIEFSNMVASWTEENIDLEVVD